MKNCNFLPSSKNICVFGCGYELISCKKKNYFLNPKVKNCENNVFSKCKIAVINGVTFLNGVFYS